jgi:hypothetical protein
MKNKYINEKSITYVKNDDCLRGLYQTKEVLFVDYIKYVNLIIQLVIIK